MQQQKKQNISNAIYKILIFLILFQCLKTVYLFKTTIQVFPWNKFPQK